VAATGIGRRSLLRGALAGAGFLGASGLLAACGSGGSSGSAGAPAQAASGALTFGSNQSDAVPKKAYEQLVTGFNDPNIKITTNTVDHNTFQENINTYLPSSRPTSWARRAGSASARRWPRSCC
jgi:multiple sugar transport system substrate-binding protein